jgi:hypothetical protein
MVGCRFRVVRLRDRDQGCFLWVLGRSELLAYRSHALRGNAVLDALRPGLW